MIKISASMLAADFSRMGEELRRIEPACDWIHADVMDGLFVPNISFGQGMVSAFRKNTARFLDVHLMIESPDRYVEAFAQCGADMITVHAEACRHLHRVVQQIHATGKQAGVALNPASPLELIQYVLGDVDMVLLMTVNPGYGGQQCIPAVMDKIAKLRDVLAQMETPPLVQVDGGVSVDTASALKQAGANVLVAGTALFSASDPVAYAHLLRHL